MPGANAQASSSKMPPEVLAQKSQKWIQMQNKRYGERRKGGYIDIGKQVRCPRWHLARAGAADKGAFCRTFHLSMSEKLSKITVTCPTENLGTTNASISAR
jgi:hypothetical protein